MKNWQDRHAALVPARHLAYHCGMRILPFIAICLGLLASPPAFSQKRPQAAAGPQKIGAFDDWTAARYQEGGRTVCYAFTYPKKSAPPVQGRSEVVLTVTQRHGGRDTVALTAGFTYAANADVSVNVDLNALGFYTSKGFAFAKDGPATVAAFQRGRQAVTRSTGPRNIPVEDTFSLKGFSAAYAATIKACPPER
jgi:hypothetical protein